MEKKRTSKKAKRSVHLGLRASFVTGLIVVVPIGITIYLTWAFITFVDNNVVPLIPDRYNPENYLPFSIPGLGLLIFVIFATSIGFLTKVFLGREILRLGERWVDRMPVVRSIYAALKQIVETIASQSQTTFREVCLVEFPRRGMWAVAFVSTEARGEIAATPDCADPVCIFVPTTPNPTSGYLFIVDRSDIRKLNMNAEEAAKLVISAGLVTPEMQSDLIVKQAV